MILVIDANNLAARANQTQDLVTKQGEKTGAIYGSLQMVQSYLKPSEDGYHNHIYDALSEQLGIEEKFERVVFTWDISSSVFRKNIYSGYKEKRHKRKEEKTPEEKADYEAFKNQMNTLQNTLPYFGIKSLQIYDWEADDLIYTVTKSVEEKCVVVSTDQDMLQLVSDRVFVWSPYKETLYTPDNFEEEKGIAKEQYLEMRKLVGDSSDEIPGIPGIGEVRAMKLLKEFGSIEGILRAKPILIQKKSFAKIFDNIEILDRNDALMNMERIPMEHLEPYVLEELEKEESFDEKKVKEFLMEKQMVSILKQLKTWSKPFKNLN
jgi:DNA polymerase-1